MPSSNVLSRLTIRTIPVRRSYLFTAQQTVRENDDRQAGKAATRSPS